MPPNGSGTPCCMVRADLTFLRTVRNILVYSDQQAQFNNPGTGNTRDALRQVLASTPQEVNFGVGSFMNGRLTIDVHQFHPRMVDDLIQLLENVLPQTGYIVEGSIPEVQRQPFHRRRKDQNVYWCLSSMRGELPENTLLLATNIRIGVIDQMEGHQVVALVLRAVNDRGRNPAEARVFLQTHLPLGTKIAKGHIRRIRNAMRTSVFRGRILLDFAGDMLSPFEGNVLLESRPIDHLGANNIGVTGNITVGNFHIEMSLI